VAAKKPLHGETVSNKINLLKSTFPPSRYVHSKALQNILKFGFWFENKPSGNPDKNAERE
jgi:hypothetical protein